MFLLEIIKTALERGGELAEDNERINRWIEGTGSLEEKQVVMRGRRRTGCRRNFCI